MHLSLSGAYTFSQGAYLLIRETGMEQRITESKGESQNRDVYIVLGKQRRKWPADVDGDRVLEESALDPGLKSILKCKKAQGIRYRGMVGSTWHGQELVGTSRWLALEAGAGSGKKKRVVVSFLMVSASFFCIPFLTWRPSLSSAWTSMWTWPSLKSHFPQWHQHELCKMIAYVTAVENMLVQF